MRKVKKHIITMVLLLCTLINMVGVSAASAAASNSSVSDAPNIDSTKIPQEIGLAMTSDPQTSMSISWTTIDTGMHDPKAIVWRKGSSDKSAVEYSAQSETRAVTGSTIEDNLDQPVLEKNFYTVLADDLTPNKEYIYRCGAYDEDGNLVMSDEMSFKTAPDNNGSYTFIYFSDSQVKGTAANGWNANLDIAERMYPNARFIYIAGDLTDKAADEGQWESFFNQPGNDLYNEEFSGSFISEVPLAAAMGNHDAANAGIGGMSSHYSWASDVDGVPVSYAFDYGAARIIIINLENAYSKDNSSAREAQEEFLRAEVEEAKNEAKWTLVGFHKSLYSGANHMDDSDVIDNRKYWGPIFAELDVDVVLQGHDHVLSRGFIGADGYKADITKGISDRKYIAKAPDNAPLYYVGNTGSTLKFYAPLPDNSWIQAGDPVAPDFGYLDINSALPAGYTTADGQVLNPGPCTNDDLEGVDADFYRTPTFTAITVSNGSILFETYMTGFDSNSNTVVEDTFLYDSLKVTRP